MNQPLATWNPELDYWETPDKDIFGHSAAYSATLPKSGTTRNGQLYESANWEDATTAPASSSSPHLPTPAASDFKRHEESPADSQRKSPGITAVSVHFPEGQKYLPTPDASMGTRGAAKSTETYRPSGARRQIKLNDLPTMLPTPNTMGEPKYFPTPKASDGVMGRSRTTGRPIEKSTHLTTIVTLLPKEIEDTNANPTEKRSPEVLRDMRRRVFSQEIQWSPGGSNAISIPQDMQPEMWEQPQSRAGGQSQMEGPSSDGSEDMQRLRNAGELAYPSHRQEPSEQRSGESGMPMCELPPSPSLERGQGTTDGFDTQGPFGVYTAAVRRWEGVLGRPAPSPTELNSKGKPRLNPEFASWMMGLPDGWVTSPEIGLTRAQQLKAIGNGVCPQQAREGLERLIGNITT